MWRSNSRASLRVAYRRPWSSLQVACRQLLAPSPATHEPERATANRKRINLSAGNQSSHMPSKGPVFSTTKAKSIVTKSNSPRRRFGDLFDTVLGPFLGVRGRYPSYYAIWRTYNCQMAEAGLCLPHANPQTKCGPPATTRTGVLSHARVQPGSGRTQHG
jgi:hypothetical protein